MPELKKRKQIRLPNYDYSENGFYFVTVCSNARESIFGEYKIPVGAGLASARNNDTISESDLELSPVGTIIESQWLNIPNQYDNVELDEYVIMPNHIHGIIVINHTKKRADARPAPTISDIICSFKSRSSVECVRYIQRNNLDMSGKIWQRSFYDHVIRNERSLSAIREYILDNPVNWQQDIENLLNL
jgi:putative transposase